MMKKTISSLMPLLHLLLNLLNQNLRLKKKSTKLLKLLMIKLLRKTPNTKTIRIGIKMMKRIKSTINLQKGTTNGIKDKTVKKLKLKRKVKERNINKKEKRNGLNKKERNKTGKIKRIGKTTKKKEMMKTLKKKARKYRREETNGKKLETGKVRNRVNRTINGIKETERKEAKMRKATGRIKTGSKGEKRKKSFDMLMKSLYLF